MVETVKNVVLDRNNIYLLAAMIFGQYITFFSILRDKLVASEVYVNVELFLNYSSLTSVIISLGLHQWFSVEYFKTNNVIYLARRILFVFLILSPLLFGATYIVGYGNFFFYAWILFFKNFINAYLVASKNYKLFMYNELSSAAVFFILLNTSLFDTRWFFLINIMSIILIFRQFALPSMSSFRIQLKGPEIAEVLNGGVSFLLNGLALWLIFTSDLWVLNEFENYNLSEIERYSSVLRLSKIGAFLVFFYVGNRVNIDLMRHLKKEGYSSFSLSLTENIHGILKRWVYSGCLIVGVNIMLYTLIYLTGIGSYPSGSLYLVVVISVHMMFELLMRMVSPIVYFYDKKIFMNVIYLIYFLLLVGFLRVFDYDFIVVKSALLFLFLSLLMLIFKFYGRRSNSGL